MDKNDSTSQSELSLDSLGCHHDRKRAGYHCHRGPLAGRSFDSKTEALEALEKFQGQTRPTEPLLALFFLLTRLALRYHEEDFPTGIN